MSRINTRTLPLKHSVHLGISSGYGEAENSLEDNGKLWIWTAGTPSSWTSIDRIHFLGKHITPVAPSLLNSWTNYGSTYESAGYYKDSNNILILKGCVRNGTSPGNIFLLPSGYYDETYDHLYPVFITNSTPTPLAGRIDLKTTGYVYDNNGGTNARTHIDGIILPIGASWTAPSLINSWLDYGGAWAPAGYTKVDNIVYLRGLIKSGASGTTAFVLPSGYRPASRVLCSSIQNGNVLARVDIDTSGNVIIYVQSSPPSWVTLEGVCFPAVSMYDVPKLNDVARYSATYFDSQYYRSGDITHVKGMLKNGGSLQYYIHLPLTPSYTYPDITGGDPAYLEDFDEAMDFGNIVRNRWSKTNGSWSITDPVRNTVNIYKEHMDDLRSCADLVDYGGSSFTYTDSTITKAVTEIKATHIEEVRQNMDDAGLFAKCNGDCTSYCGSSCGSACTLDCDTSCNTGCTTDCQSGCTASCRDSCSVKCDSSCTSSCNSSCSGGCGSSSCGGTCASNCYNVCYGNCNSTCEGGFFLPHGICLDGCWGNCSSTCYGGCTGACASGCSNSCYSSCTTNCHSSCTSTCGDNCNSTCQSTCSQHCYSDCTTECGSNCTATCSNDCDSGCVGNCYNTCMSSCYSGCSYTARYGSDAGSL